MQQEQEQEQQPSQLTLTDIYKMRSVIDVASTRGTFQGKEMSLIGDLYNKLDIIVQAVEKKTETNSTPDNETEIVDENNNEEEIAEDKTVVNEN